MPYSAASRLLNALEPLPYPDRMRLLAAQTRQLAADGLLDEVLDEFAAADEYVRELGFSMAKIARRTDRLVVALADPAERIRVRALHACVRIRQPHVDEQVLATLDDAPLVWRRNLIRAVSAAGRTDVADLLATAERGRLGDRDVARLLPVCSPAVVAALLPELALHVRNWTRLGDRHPDIVLDYARAELATLPEAGYAGWFGAHGSALVAAAGHASSRVFELIEEFTPRSGLPYQVLRHLPVLIRADADRTLRLLITSQPRLTFWWRALSHTTRKRLVQREQPELVLVGRAYAQAPADFARILRDLPPSARSGFYDAVTADRDAATAIVPNEVLAALPRARRHAEVRRMLALDALAQQPERQLALSALLPWAEARPELRRAARRADPTERAAGYALLVRCAAASGDPDVVTELLTAELDRLRNEQDPVRLAVMTALAEVPLDLFAPEKAVADALGRLVTDTVEARDGSSATRERLGWLAVRLLSRQIADGADGSGPVSAPLLDGSLSALERLAGSSGYFPNTGRLDRILRRGQEHTLYRILEPWIDRGLARSDHALPVALARSLGRRAWAIPALQEKLEHAIWTGTAATARSAIGFWLGDPARRDERVARLVAWDPSVAVIGEVARVLSLRRTDLLESYLAGEVVGGKFIAHGAVWLPAFEASRRWLPRQLAAYAALLDRIVRDAAAKIPARVNAIHRLGRLPGDEQRRVLRYLDSAEVALAEAAIGVLAWSDDPGAVLPVLLGYADGDRARVAVYAATRAARFARPSVAAAALRSVATSPTAKVTSRKEVLRIAAELEVPGLVDLLIEAWRSPGQHRDVKAAAVSRLVDLMDDARVTPLLREAIDDDPAVTAMLLRMHPFAVPDRHRTAYGELIVAACTAADPKTAASALSVAARWYRWADSAAGAVCAAVLDLDRRGEYAASPTTLFALLHEGMPLTRYAHVLAELLAADEADTADTADRPCEAEAAGTCGASDRPIAAIDPGPVPERDRPARRRLMEVVRTAMLDNPDIAWRRAVLAATVDVLAGHVGYVAVTAQAAAATVELSGDPATVTAQLLDLAARAEGRHDAAEKVAHQVARVIVGKDLWSAESVLAATETLALRGDPAAGLIAVRVLAAGGGALGWPGPYRQSIRALRRHPDPAVAEAALDVDIEPS